MKKQTQIFAVMSAAALLSMIPSAVGQSGIAYAADCGWTEEEGSMVYYDEDGERLTDTWKKEGNDWIYLNEDGHITTNQKIDDYYVGPEGTLVRQTWIELASEEEPDSPEMPASHWYYFDENGKAVTANWLRHQDKWYYFDESGHMLTGKVNIDDSWYYLGCEQDGAMKTGWIRLNENASSPDSEESWHYFNKNGTMVETQYDRKIDGNYYTFIDGKMQTGWVEMPETETDGASGTSEETSTASNAKRISDYQYYGKEGDGKRASGWHTIEGIENIHDPDETYTFYFRNGQALHSSLEGNQLFTVNGKKYAFNERGEMQTGLQSVHTADGTSANYYFGDDGIMRTGKQSIYNEETGENDSWFFHSEGDRRGQGYHGLRDHTLYLHGKRQEAASDQKYAPVKLDDVTYLVNTSGTVQKASSSSTSAAKPELGRGFRDFKDNNGTVWTVNTSGIIQ